MRKMNTGLREKLRVCRGWLIVGFSSPAWRTGLVVDGEVADVVLGVVLLVPEHHIG